jgi:hypothetical protein
VTCHALYLGFGRTVYRCAYVDQHSGVHSFQQPVEPCRATSPDGLSICMLPAQMPHVHEWEGSTEWAGITMATNDDPPWSAPEANVGLSVATREIVQLQAKVERLRVAFEALERTGREVGSWRMTAPAVAIEAFANALNEARKALDNLPPQTAQAREDKKP